MASTAGKTKRGSIRRMLAATLALTLLYIGLQELLVGGLSVLNSTGRIASTFQGALDEEANRVAEASAAREAQLTPEHRLAAYALGVHLGRASQYLGSFGLSDPAVRQQARAALAPRLKAAQELADFLGIGPVYPLESSTAAQFSSLNARVAADEGGVGARIADRTTPRHQHLYLLGMYVGMTIEAMQSDAWSGGAVPGQQVARQATLAGLSRDQWAPLAREPSGATRREIAAAYEAAARNVQQAIVSNMTAGKR